MTDATGTPTPLGIPTYDTDADRPTGQGFNEAMAQVDAVIALNRPFLNVKSEPYNATGLGVANDSVAIQAAIDDANAAGGGTVYFPPGIYLCNIILKQNVTLTGTLGGNPTWGAGGAPTILQQAVAGAVIDTPAGATVSMGIYDLSIIGAGAGVAGKGIRFRNVAKSQIKRVTLDNFADEGLLVEAGGASVFEDILALNCVLNRARATFIGAIDISGADQWLVRLEATISGSLQGTVQSANLYCVGIAVRGDNGFYDGVVGEISDIGIYVSGSYNRFSNCRADLNYGHGFYVPGSSNQFSSSLALSNSQDTTNTYDGWHFPNGSGNNVTEGCYAANNQVKVQRYGFYDDQQSGSNKNRHSNPFASGNATGPFRNSTNHGSLFLLPGGYVGLSYSASIANDLQYGGKYFAILVTNGSPFTIQNPTNHVFGQEITYIIGNGSGGVMNTITWGSEFRLAAFTNPAAGFWRTISFVRDGSQWLEIGRSTTDI